MRRTGRLCAVVLCFALSARRAEADGKMTERLKGANIVFHGTVVEVGAVSFSDVPQSEHTHVVRVDDVFEKPETFPLRRGDVVTVLVPEPGTFQVGMGATFFATGWIYGDGLALRVLSHAMTPPGTSAFDAVAEQAPVVAAGLTAVEDERLRARLNAAEAVVVGTVTDIRPVQTTLRPTVSEERPIISEHDPEWREAVIRVSEGLKGAVAGEALVVRFPQSRDVRWFMVPKFERGQQGTFFLQRDELSGRDKTIMAGAPAQAYVVPTAADVMSADAASRVRGLAPPP